MYLARIGRPDIPWVSKQNLHEQSPNGPDLVTNDYLVDLLHSSHE